VAHRHAGRHDERQECAGQVNRERQQHKSLRPSGEQPNSEADRRNTQGVHDHARICPGQRGGNQPGDGRLTADFEQAEPEKYQKTRCNKGNLNRALSSGTRVNCATAVTCARVPTSHRIERTASLRSAR
jgi:hypothetical protein